MDKDTIEKLTGELIPERATGSPVNAYVNGFEDGIKNTSIDLSDTVTVTLTKKGAEIVSEIEKYHDNAKEYKEWDNFTTELRFIFMIFEKYVSRGEAVFTNLRLKEYDEGK